MPLRRSGFTLTLNMPFSQTDSTKPYILLKGIERSNKFITSNIQGEDHTRSAEGELWYEIIGYADTIPEAQQHLYGRSFS